MGSLAIGLVAIFLGGVVSGLFTAPIVYIKHWAWWVGMRGCGEALAAAPQKNQLTPTATPPYRRPWRGALPALFCAYRLPALGNYCCAAAMQGYAAARASRAGTVTPPTFPPCSHHPTLTHSVMRCGGPVSWTCARTSDLHRLSCVRDDPCVQRYVRWERLC